MMNASGCSRTRKRPVLLLEQHDALQVHRAREEHDAEQRQHDRDLVAHEHGDDAHRAEERVLVVGAVPGHEHGQRTERRRREQEQHTDVEVRERHVASPRQHRHQPDAGHGEHDRRQREDQAGRGGRLQHFLLHQLDRVGDGLKQAERPEAVRAETRLHAADDAPLDPDVDDGDAADERDDAQRPQQRRDDVDQPVRPARVTDQLLDLSAQVGEITEVEPVAGDDRQQREDHRSSSPTLMSMLPSVTMASAIVLPTVISFSTLRLISDGARTCQRYGAGPPSLTT